MARNSTAYFPQRARNEKKLSATPALGDVTRRGGRTEPVRVALAGDVCGANDLPDSRPAAWVVKRGPRLLCHTGYQRTGHLPAPSPTTSSLSLTYRRVPGRGRAGRRGMRKPRSRRERAALCRGTAAPRRCPGADDRRQHQCVCGGGGRGGGAGLGARVVVVDPEVLPSSSSPGRRDADRRSLQPGGNPAATSYESEPADGEGTRVEASSFSEQSS